VPGEADCQSEIHSFTVNEDGGYELAVPIDCDCAYLEYHYFISFHFVTEFAESDRANARLDEYPELCTSWQNWGEGWFDMVGDLGYEGDIMIWADVGCCEDPTASDSAAWSDLKSLYS
jgi:hypothetical protein